MIKSGTRCVWLKSGVLEIVNLKRVWRWERKAVGLVDGTAGTVVRELRKVPLNAWKGETVEGDPVHVSYQSGELVVEVDVAGRSGRRSVRVLRWDPHYSLALANSRLSKEVPLRDRLEAASLARETARRAATRAINGKTVTLSESQLREWLDEREKHLGRSAAGRSAAGRVRIRIVK